MIGERRRYLRDESVDAFEDVPGLRSKAWISDEATERWGARYASNLDATSSSSKTAQHRRAARAS
jgi:hypothetical protein